ncbi:hypothetical protein XENTR_v10004635 [Xenopus tropicalis]|nr:hypothetical protein XENTR_v10004635 [Xenopus tropicalis]
MHYYIPHFLSCQNDKHNFGYSYANKHHHCNGKSSSKVVANPLQTCGSLSVASKWAGSTKTLHHSLSFTLTIQCNKIRHQYYKTLHITYTFDYYICMAYFTGVSIFYCLL